MKDVEETSFREPEPEPEVYALTPGGWSIFDYSVQVLLRNHAAAEGLGFDPADLNIYTPVIEEES